MEKSDLPVVARKRANKAVSTAAEPNRQDKLTALLHHIDIDVLRASFFGLKKTAAPGVDEMTWTEYAKHLEANLLDLHARVHTGAYRALPSRRKYIPKADGRQGRSASPP
jgi:RNA-directed DNA polymerase